ncbi:hypothetical protein SESBI_48892 [Sesbania bispinosa]|nr:hypothetical protein SESBI_48892 [Sesbania bispinosa]
MAKESLCAKKKECGNGKMMMKKNLDHEGFAKQIIFAISNELLVKEGLDPSQILSTCTNHVMEGGSITISFLKSQCNEESKKSLKRKRENQDNVANKNCKTNNNSNIANVNDVILDQPVGLPMTFQEKIQEMEGREVKLVIQKQLFKSDLNSNNGRFSIPIQQIRHDARDFLTETDEFCLKERKGEGKNQRLVGFPVAVLDPSLKLYNMCFKKWKMEHTEVYNITSGWNELLRNNCLKAKDTVQLWSFRSNSNQLCFALVKL